ncbi:hypothetical protein F5X96DRAFT_657603 [Biscogniauxia mediterranea]|nr:hypothetical protein F5X96DRAFT_657603 [Biscogniauxia mediterranea]
MKWTSFFLLTATALVGAHAAAALQSDSSLSGSPELAPRLFHHSDCDDSSGSDNEGQGGGKRRRSDAVKCGEILRRPGVSGDLTRLTQQGMVEGGGVLSCHRANNRSFFWEYLVG